MEASCVIQILKQWVVADPGGGGPGPSPTPVKTRQQKDGNCVGSEVLRVIAPPPNKFLDSLLVGFF